MAIEKCSKCDSLIDDSAPAFVFSGEIVCVSCDQLLREGYNILGADGDANGKGWDLDLAKKRRKLYLLFFVLKAIGNVITWFVSPFGILLALPCLVLFMIYFFATARLVKGYSAVKIVFLCLGLFIPLVSLIVLVCVDSSLYKAIKEREGLGRPPEEAKRRFCSWGLYSFLLIPLPLIGLPLGIVGLVKISKSEGKLYGKTLAWIAVVLNSLLLLFIAFLMAVGFIENLKGG